MQFNASNFGRLKLPRLTFQCWH